MLFRRPQMVVFFLCAMMLGGALQITNAFGGDFLTDFNASFPDSFGVNHPILLSSISQISETVFILTIPFFLQRFGIKVVMLIAIFAWMLRFGLFAFGDPGPGLWMLVLSMIVYGMAFDFFNISGSMYVNLEANPRIRASAQGLFMIMTNGLGAFFGTMLAGAVVDHYTVGGVRDWQSIWLSFAGYALVLGARVSVRVPLPARSGEDGRRCHRPLKGDAPLFGRDRRSSFRRNEKGCVPF